MKRIAYLTFCMFLVLFCLEARETKLQASDNGLLGAMDRLGCSPNWISIVMRQSNILEVELRHLPVGALITAPDECTTYEPSDEDVAVSKAVLERDTLGNANLLALQEEVGKLKTDLANEKREIATLKSEKTITEGQHAVWQEKIKGLEKDLAESRSREVGMGTKIFGFLLGFVVAATLATLFAFWYEKRMLFVPRKKQIIHVGKAVTFTLTPFVPNYTCPECHASDIQENFDRHLQRKHPNLRLTVVNKATA